MCSFARRAWLIGTADLAERLLAECFLERDCREMKFPLIICSVAAICSVSIWALGERRQNPQTMQLSLAATPFPVRSGEAVVAAPARGHVRALIVVDVEGAVTHPGLRSLRIGERVADAVRAAGGVTRGADLTALNRAELLADGTEIVVPMQGDVSLHSGKAKHAEVKSAKQTGRVRHRRRRRRNDVDPTSTAAPVRLLDLNAASALELEKLPGLNPELATRIVAVRRAAGNYESLDDLLDVQGMNESRLARVSSRFKELREAD
jgi:DNA uptake protein ComE-like DNA-binding protein